MARVGGWFQILPRTTPSFLEAAWESFVCFCLPFHFFLSSCSHVSHNNSVEPTNKRRKKGDHSFKQHSQNRWEKKHLKVIACFKRCSKNSWLPKHETRLKIIVLRTSWRTMCNNWCSHSNHNICFPQETQEYLEVLMTFCQSTQYFSFLGGMKCLHRLVGFQTCPWMMGASGCSKLGFPEAYRSLATSISAQSLVNLVLLGLNFTVCQGMAGHASWKSFYQTNPWNLIILAEIQQSARKNRAWNWKKGSLKTECPELFKEFFATCFFFCACALKFEHHFQWKSKPIDNCWAAHKVSRIERYF